ncbi:hypothetical protein [Paraflavitalea pollutisoli]|uniref:hypothetical protein n=1 Tax=Paraflavitalea pollutisoli TaxID=3034143 RepID=UPI0023EDE93C|nr:hypothetical protein [Paraflavitalea sp. H1-2-19X]
MRYQGKRVIWENKARQWRAVLIASGFVALILFVGPTSSAFMYWGGLVFFGGGGLAVLVRLLYPGNLFVSGGSPLLEKIFEEQYRRDSKDPGLFEYTDTGFFFCQGKIRTYFEWQNITAVFGRKEDARTYDVISIDIFTDLGKGLTLHEEMPGWIIFNKALKKQFPAVPANWDLEITDPPFDTELTLLYDRGGRSKEEALLFHYKIVD